jgi:hypothetical protein
VLQIVADWLGFEFIRSEGLAGHGIVVQALRRAGEGREQAERQLATTIVGGAVEEAARYGARVGITGAPWDAGCREKGGSGVRGEARAAA